jgi:hypothetical protein
MKTTTKKNISLETELMNYMLERAKKNTDKERGTKATLSSQMAVAVRLLMEEDAANYNVSGKAQSPQSTAAPTARTSERYSAPKKPSRIS